MKSLRLYTCFASLLLSFMLLSGCSAFADGFSRGLESTNEAKPLVQTSLSEVDKESDNSEPVYYNYAYYKSTRGDPPITYTGSFISGAVNYIYTPEYVLELLVERGIENVTDLTLEVLNEEKLHPVSDTMFVMKPGETTATEMTKEEFKVFCLEVWPEMYDLTDWGED